MEIINLQIEIFFLLAVGYFLSKKGYFSKSTRSQMINIVLSLVLPCSIIESFQIDINHELIVSTGVILVISVAIQGLYAILNMFLYNRQPENKKINCQYATMVSNAGFMGMPIAQGVFGSMGLLYASIFLIPQRIFMWSAGLSLYAKDEGNKGGILKKVLTHPCLIAIYIGVALMGLRQINIFLPKPIEETVVLIGQCNTALSMIAIGGILSEVDYKHVFDKFSVLYSMYRLVLIPLIILLFVRVLRIDALPANLCVLLSAMPAASTTAMLAEKYDRDPLFASQLIFVSTMMSLVTLPLITMLFQHI